MSLHLSAVVASAWEFGWTALASIFTAVAAGATAVYAYLVYRQLAESKTDRELTRAALELQRARDLRDTEARERGQASLISTSCSYSGDGSIYVKIQNHSPVTIVDVRWFWTDQQGNSTVSPERWEIDPATFNHTTVPAPMNRAIAIGACVGSAFCSATTLDSVGRSGPMVVLNRIWTTTTV